jgi:hypothetical protein
MVFIEDKIGGETSPARISNLPNNISCMFMMMRE